MENANYLIKINVAKQVLALYKKNNIINQYLVSTAKNGVGEFAGSECTPTGSHIIRAKIGRGFAPNTVFVGRRPTGEIYTPSLRTKYPERDWMLTRILWLCGKEPGKNRFGNVDTMGRYIYIHGAPDEDIMGIPNSRGCVRMRNQDLIELFEIIPVGTDVYISKE